MTSTSMDMGYAGLIVLVLYALLLAVAVALIVAGLVTRKRAGGAAGDTAGGVCGACGYPVRGLVKLNCPECGADLREAGISRPKGNRTAGTAMLVSGIVLAVLLGMCCVSPLILWGSSASVQVSPSATTISPSPAPAPGSP